MKRALIFVFLLITSPAFARSTVLSLTVDHGLPLTLNGAASSVFIANPEIADVQVMSPTQVMIFGKRTGETSFMATDSEGHTLAERTVIVSQDLAELRAELNAAIPGNAIKATPIPNGIVLTGTAKDPTSVADAYKIAMRYMPTGGDIINRVQVNGSNQIQIHVRFAEVQRNIDNTLGFDLANAVSVGGGVAIGLFTGNTVNTALQGTNGTNGATGLFPRPSNTTLSQSNDVLGGSYQGKRFNLNGMIDALAQDGLITILAEPSLTAMSGETANFLAGGEFPIPIPQGNGTISVTFKSYGISLDFTPTLLSGNRISLHVRPEVSELTDVGAIVLGNITVPALTTRKAETTVEVGSGESFAIAGLMNNSQAQTITKYPLLGDIPVLGALFRSSHFQNGQTELMVIITPYVVTPSGQKMALPTDGLAPPSESERLVGLRYSSSDPDARPISGDPVAVPAAPMASPVAAVTTTPTVSAPAAAAPSTVIVSPSLQEDEDVSADVVMAPASPVSAKTTIVSTPAPRAAPQVITAPAAAPIVAPTVNASPVVITPDVMPTATPTTVTKTITAPPVVLHNANDPNKHAGGILVE